MTVLSSFLPLFFVSTRHPFHFIFLAIPILPVPLEFRATGRAWLISNGVSSYSYETHQQIAASFCLLAAPPGRQASYRSGLLVLVAACSISGDRRQIWFRPQMAKYLALGHWVSASDTVPPSGSQSAAPRGSGEAPTSGTRIPDASVRPAGPALAGCGPSPHRPHAGAARFSPRRRPSGSAAAVRASRRQKRRSRKHHWGDKEKRDSVATPAKRRRWEGKPGK
jgi:hypothetical protein